MRDIVLMPTAAGGARLRAASQISYRTVSRGSTAAAWGGRMISSLPQGTLASFLPPPSRAFGPPRAAACGRPVRRLFPCIIHRERPFGDPFRKEGRQVQKFARMQSTMSGINASAAAGRRGKICILRNKGRKVTHTPLRRARPSAGPKGGVT